MIKIENLKKQFGQTVACDIPSFTINDGDMLGLVGNNGAGKTTLFRMMLDLLKPDEGSVGINGINPAQSEDWKYMTGAYIDEGFLIDYLTPEEYFSFIGKISGTSQKRSKSDCSTFERFAAGEVLRTEEAHPQPLGRQQAEGGHHLRTHQRTAAGHPRRAVQLPRPHQPEHA